MAAFKHLSCPSLTTLSPLILRAPMSRELLRMTVSRPTRQFFSPISAARFHPSPARLRPFSIASFRRLSSPSSTSSRWPTFHPYRQVRSISMRDTPIAQNILGRLEQSANQAPNDVSQQKGFYSALLRLGYPEIVAERYETGRYATNPAVDALYTQAIERLEQAGGAATVGAGVQGLSSDTLKMIGRTVATTQKIGGVATANSGTGAKSSPLYVTVDESRKILVFRIVKFILYFILTAYISLLVLNLAFEMSGAFRKLPGTQGSTTAVKPEDQKTRFSDVKGCDEAIEEMQEVVEFLRHPEKFNQLGGKLPKGILMIGPPGTGKTLLARAVAGEAGVPFFYMSGSEFDEVYVGVGAKRVRELFAQAKAKAPAIVFIDEIDAVGGKRNERDASYHMQTLNQMLTELDGFEQTSGVIFIGATNFPQMLDKALTRPGRFDRQVIVPLPDVRGRMAILTYHMRNMQISKDLDPTAIARGTPGFSGADLENLVNQAAVHASKNNAKTIGMKDLDWAKDRIMMGAQKTHMVVQEKDKLMTAYHEAGHALMGHFNEAATPLYKITILPRGQTLGVTHFLPEMDRVSESKREMLAHIDVCMGGKMAEELIYGAENVTSGCSSDLLNATQTAYNMVTRYGMGDTLGGIAFNEDSYNTLSTETKHKVEAEVRRILDDSQERTRAMLKAKRVELEILAQGLIKYETLSKDEMAKVLKGEALPEDEKSTSLPGVPVKLPEIVLPGKPVLGVGEETKGKKTDPLSTPGASGAQG